MENKEENEIKKIEVPDDILALLLFHTFQAGINSEDSLTNLWVISTLNKYKEFLYPFKNQIVHQVENLCNDESNKNIQKKEAWKELLIELKK